MLDAPCRAVPRPKLTGLGAADIVRPALPPPYVKVLQARRNGYADIDISLVSRR